MSDDVRTRVHRIIAEQAMIDVDQVTDASSFDDLGLDSLSLVEVVFAIEEAFDITVPYNANEPDASEFDISTVGKVVEGIEALIAQKA